jgi:hypothetical protein
MATYYLDTSALVKRYARERGTDWVQQLTHPLAHHRLYTVRITGPEMIAALARKRRMGQVSLTEAQQFANDFRVDWQRQYRIIEITERVAELGMTLADRYGLRGYDSVHLSAALILHEVRQSLKLSQLTFVSADKEQLEAAVLEGLVIDNPNDYP